MILGSKDFDFELPSGYIAQQPAGKRDESCLMVYDRKKLSVNICAFRDIAKYFKSGDCLVINESKVLPARFFGKKNTGGRVELLYLNGSDGDINVLLKPSLKTGVKVMLDGGAAAELKKRNSDGSYAVNFFWDKGGVRDYLYEYGVMPLPPYIKRKTSGDDLKDYQTVYAKKEGSVAAPTAGLHFTDTLLSEIESNGVDIARITLHIGLGTFKKIKTDDFASFDMHSEYFEIPGKSAEVINKAKFSGKNVFAVGTSCIRSLESAAKGGFVQAKSAMADIFIYPGYVFKIVDKMITNFHLPDSGPLFLTAAFLHNSAENINDAPKLIKKLYTIAVERKFRFYSYGDAMLIL